MVGVLAMPPAATAQQKGGPVEIELMTYPEIYAAIHEQEITMAVFYIGSYDIVDMNAFQMYPPVVLSLLPKYGGEVLASDTAATVVEGTGRTMNAIIRFPSKEAALGLYNDPAYQEAKRVRQLSTRNVSMVLVEEFQSSTGREPTASSVPPVRT